MKYTWTKWATNRPPAELKIVGAWDDPPEKEGALHSTGTRCRNPAGCCFWADHGSSLIPPIWWRPDSAGESK